MEACNNPEILRVIMFISQILKVVFIIVPIGLIIMMALDFFKNITTSKEEDMKKNAMIAIKRVVYCVCIFFVPTIVNLVNSIVNEVLEDTNINYAECFKNANVEYIKERTIDIAKEYLTTAKTTPTMSNVISAQTAIEKIDDDSLREELLEEVEDLKDNIIEEAEKEREEQEKQNQVIPSTSGSSSGGSSNFENYGTGGKERDYFAPIQVPTYDLSNISSTPGCSNKVYHDLSGVAEGTPIYAGMDGTAQFMQTSSSLVVSDKTVLTGYGNQVRITASDGTYIIYAHLQKFANGIKAPITETCPKKGNTPPCSTTVYSSSTVISDTREVKKGDLIGYLGNTGNSTAAHLHVEIHERGSSYCISDPWLHFGMK